MGIAGLLPLLKSVTEHKHLETLSGCTVAVDAYSWLHKGAYACAPDLFHARPTSAHINFCLHRIRLFLHHRINVILVFDGGPLPMKAGKETERQRSRAEARAKALSLLEQGKLAEASVLMPKAIDITPEMAHQLIMEVKRLNNSNVSYLVAPYEADAQLAFLCKSGVVSAVISEDSDLLLFGVQRLCVKLDAKTGYFEEIRSERISATREIDLKGVSLKKFRQICILSGCDYLDSLNGMGLKTAYRYFIKYSNYERVLQVLRAEGRAMPEDYEEGFVKAELSFCHQRIYNSLTRKIQCLQEKNENTFPFDDDSFLGPVLPDSVAHEIAVGRLHPITFKSFTEEKQAAKDDDKQISIKSPHLQPLIDKRLTVKRSVVNAEYSLYFNSSDTMFPAVKRSQSLDSKNTKSIKNFFDKLS